MRINGEPDFEKAGYVLGWIVLAAAAATALVLVIVGIWTRDGGTQGRLFGTAIVIFSVSALGAAALADWAESRGR